MKKAEEVNNDSESESGFLKKLLVKVLH